MYVMHLDVPVNTFKIKIVFIVIYKHHIKTEITTINLNKLM